jgi:hypothetical protein
MDSAANDVPAVTVTVDDLSQTVVAQSADVTVTVQGWSSHFSPRLFNVRGAVVWAAPALADVEVGGLQNAEDVYGKVALVRRGAVPIARKAHVVQYHGAIGCIVVDDGSCSRYGYDQRCLPGADKTRGEGWGRHDVPDAWCVVT